jgi:hypothetical protein
MPRSSGAAALHGRGYGSGRRYDADGLVRRSPPRVRPACERYDPVRHPASRIPCRGARGMVRLPRSLLRDRSGLPGLRGGGRIQVSGNDPRSSGRRLRLFARGAHRETPTDPDDDLLGPPRLGDPILDGRIEVEEDPAGPARAASSISAADASGDGREIRRLRVPSVLPLFSSRGTGGSWDPGGVREVVWSRNVQYVRVVVQLINCANSQHTLERRDNSTGPSYIHTRIYCCGVSIFSHGREESQQEVQGRKEVGEERKVPEEVRRTGQGPREDLLHAGPCQSRSSRVGGVRRNFSVS